MAFPAQIIGAPQGYIQNSSGSHQDSAFEYSGNQYFLGAALGLTGTPDGDKKFHMLKSTDGGNIYAELDAAHAPVVGATGGGWSSGQAICRDGTTVWLIGSTQAGFVTSGVAAFSFNLISETWTIGPTSAVIFPQFSFPFYSPQIILVRRGPGDMEMFYSGLSETVSGVDYARIYTVTFTGLAWGTPAMIPTESGQTSSYVLGAVFVDGSGYTTMFFHATDGTGKLLSLAHDPSGTWGSNVIVDSVNNFYLGGGNEANLPYGDVIQFGSDIGVAMAFTSSDDRVVIYWASAGTLTPTWSKAAVATGLSDTLPFLGIPGKSIALILASDGNLYAVWCLNSNDVHYPFNGKWQYAKAASGSPGSWSAAADLFSTTGSPSADWGAYSTQLYNNGAGIGVVAVSANGNSGSLDFDGLSDAFYQIVLSSGAACRYYGH